MAIFQIGAERDYSTICAAALKAGRAARNQIAALSAIDGDGSGLRFGLALHVGDVLFGNIGSGNRLDFTCIGPAVNLAARLENLPAAWAEPSSLQRISSITAATVAYNRSAALPSRDLPPSKWCMASPTREKTHHERTGCGGDRDRLYLISHSSARHLAACAVTHDWTLE